MTYAPPPSFVSVSESFGVKSARYQPRFLNQQRADALLAKALAELAWQREQLTLFGRDLLAPRLSAWYGLPGASYRYSGTERRAAPWPAFVERLAAEVGATVGWRFNYVLVNRYRDGQDMLGWHADDEADLGPAPVIATASVGGERMLRMRSRRDRGTATDSIAARPLAHGSLLLMWGRCQRDYQHCVPRTARPVTERVSFTFRWTSGRGPTEQAEVK